MSIYKFIIDYNGKIEKRKISYLTKEFSFNIMPKSLKIEFGLVMNYLDLTILDGKVIEVLGYCPSKSWISTEAWISEYSPGELKVIGPPTESHVSHRLKDSEWPVYINRSSGWVCIGNPLNSSKGVEFISNCVVILEGDGEMSALWLKPEFIDN